MVSEGRETDKATAFYFTHSREGKARLTSKMVVFMVPLMETQSGHSEDKLWWLLPSEEAEGFNILSTSTIVL